MPYCSPEASDSQDLEIVIVNFNGGELLVKCLDSIFASEPEKRVVVTVVDNASTDGSDAIVEERFGDRVQLIGNPENVGFARGNNIALRRSRTRYVFLLNSDASLPRQGNTGHVLDRVIRILDEDPTTGALGPRILRPDGLPEQSTGSRVAFRNVVRDNLLKLFRIPPRIAGRWSKSLWSYDHRREVDWVTGAALAVRGDVLRQGCLLDEGYFMYAEDVEWCYRIQKLGWKIVFDPTVTVEHVGHGSAPDSFTAARRKQLHREGLLRFTELHPSPWFWALRMMLRAFLRRGSDSVEGTTRDVRQQELEPRGRTPAGGRTSV